MRTAGRAFAVVALLLFPAVVPAGWRSPVAPAIAAAATGPAGKAGPEPRRTGGEAPPDTTAISRTTALSRTPALSDTVTVSDSTAVAPPRGYAPDAPARRDFLRPSPADKGDSLVGLSTFDEFLLPPRGPGIVFDRTDLRLAGTAEWWETLRDVPGLFVLEPGYPGVTSAFSFRGHGPGGTRIVHDARPLAGGITPVENPNPYPANTLAGAAVIPVGASHIYGPGSGGGALLLFPIAQAPDRPFTEITSLTGIFGQRGGSITTAVRWGRAGALFHYAGAGADPWSLFGGFRAERAGLRVDWVRSGVRVSAAGWLQDEKLKGIDFPSKRSDDGEEGTISVEARLGGPWVGALRGVRQRSQVRSDGASGYTQRELQRTGSEALVRAVLGDRTSVGAMIGIHRDRLSRVAAGAQSREQSETGGYALARGRMSIVGSWELDGAARYDRYWSRQDVWAAGLTMSRAMGATGALWAHLARTTDRPAYVHRTTDFYTQLDQGVDLPRPEGRAVQSGVVVAAGIRHNGKRLGGEVALTADRYDRLVEVSPVIGSTPFALDDPDALTFRTVEDAGVLGSFRVGPVSVGRILGNVMLGGSGFASFREDDDEFWMDPRRLGEVHARLRKDLLKGALRVEGELGVRALGPMSTPFEELDSQAQVYGRASARIGDALLFYRSESIFSDTYLSAAYDADLGFVPVTQQNVTFGLSWALLD